MSFSKSQNKEYPNSTSIRVGSWVTSYNAGYWQISAIFPKYADQDYQTKSFSCKKGDRLRDWVILKKGFTTKLKFRLGSDYSDSYWIKPVGKEVLDKINLFFQENPQKYQQFLDYEVAIPPEREGVWINIPSEEIQDLKESLKKLPNRFTKNDLSAVIRNCGLHCEISKPPADYVIWLSCFYWELSEAHEQLFFLSDSNYIMGQTNY